MIDPTKVTGPDGVHFTPIILGFDYLLYRLLPHSWFVRHVASSLEKQRAPYFTWLRLPDGTLWNRNGRPAPKTEETK